MGSKTTTSTFTLGGWNIHYNGTAETRVRTNITYSFVTSINSSFLSNWRKLIADGSCATTGLTVNAQTVQIDEGSVKAFYKVNGTGNLMGDELTPILDLVTGYPTISALSLADARATRKLYAGIREAHQQFAGGVFLGEIKQTVGLIVSPAKAILKLTQKYLFKQRNLIKVMRKRGASSKSITKAISGNYLEWTFGVKPLMADIEDATLALYRAMDDPPRHYFIYSGKADSGPTRTTYGPTAVGSVSWDKYEENSQRSYVKYYGVFEEAKRNPELLARIQHVASLSGFSLTQIIPTVWELIPFSFVADYFVNIGDMLEAVMTDTSSVKWISRTAVNEAKRVYNVIPDGSKFAKSLNPTFVYQSTSGRPGSVTLTTRSISRSASSVPYLEPRLNFDQSGAHIANLAALVLNRRSVR